MYLWNEVELDLLFARKYWNPEPTLILGDSRFYELDCTSFTWLIQANNWKVGLQIIVDFILGTFVISEWVFLPKWWVRNKSYIFKLMIFMAINIIAFYWNCVRRKLLSWFSLNYIQEQIHFLLCSKKSGPLQSTVQCVKLHS